MKMKKKNTHTRNEKKNNIKSYDNNGDKQKNQQIIDKLIIITTKIIDL